MASSMDIKAPPLFSGGWEGSGKEMMENKGKDIINIPLKKSITLFQHINDIKKNRGEGIALE